MKKIPAPVRWFGGKGGTMLGKILPLIPWSELYVEPFGGAASVLWNLRPRPVEVYNDLDGDLVNLFRCLQDEEKSKKMIHRIDNMLFSRSEFELSLSVLRKPFEPTVERAIAFYTGQNLIMSGFNSRTGTVGSWQRSFSSSKNMAMNVSSWEEKKKKFDFWCNRIKRVQIDNRDALEVIKYWDSTKTTFYLDPPYVHETRKEGSRDVYEHEMTDDFHRALVDVLKGVKGNVILSGYDTCIYDPLKWNKMSFHTADSSAVKNRTSGLQKTGSSLLKGKRVECIWRKINNPFSL